MKSDLDEFGEPFERKELPWFKDPSIKLSVWKIIKDSIGQDLFRISVPVYFNDPTNMLQKGAQGMEYSEILDQAAEEVDPMRRIALIAIHQITAFSYCERSSSKPINPLLGETYELVTDKF